MWIVVSITVVFSILEHWLWALLFVRFTINEFLRSVLCLLMVLFAFRMLLKLYSSEVHSRMSFSMLLKVLKRNHSQCPSTKVWILKVPFIWKTNWEQDQSVKSANICNFVMNILLKKTDTASCLHMFVKYIKWSSSYSRCLELSVSHSQMIFCVPLCIL